MKIALSVLFILSFTTTAAQQQTLKKQLDTIRRDDQRYRDELHNIATRYAADTALLWQKTEEMWSTIDRVDFLNMIKVSRILRQYGWPSRKQVGEEGSQTVFMVIQHAEADSQYKYLPLMREAVKKGNARKEDLALLEDRVALNRGKRQIYGTQVGRNSAGNTFYVLPLQDPDHVDERRKQMGLETLQQYLSHWHLQWNPTEYKLLLPQLDSVHNIH